MWLRFSSLFLFVTALSSLTATATPRVKLTDRDRGAIVASVARNLFKPGANYEGEHFILADGIRAEWIPKISGYEVRLVSREELRHTSTRIFYYVFQLRPSTRSVHVTIRAYDSETTDLHVELHYSYSRTRHGWRGKYLWGAGD